MSEKNFKIKHGLNLGDHEIITAEGNIVLPVGRSISDANGNAVGLPSQSGQSGKYLVTDGTNSSWQTITQYTPPTNIGADMYLAGDGTYKHLASSIERATFTATALQTSFPITYTVGNVDVYLNGIKLTPTVDFTATDGTSVVLNYGATLNDTVDIIAYGTFQVANTYTKDVIDSKVSNISWQGVQNKPAIPTITVVGSSLYITT